MGTAAMDKSKMFTRRVFINDIDSYASENIAKVPKKSSTGAAQRGGVPSQGGGRSLCLSAHCAVPVRVHGGVAGPRRGRDRHRG